MELFDRYAFLDSVVHRLDARAKLVALGLVVPAVVLTPHGRFLSFGGYAVLALIIASLTRIPLGWLLSRALPVVPLALVSLGVALLTQPASPQDALRLCGHWSVSAAALTWAVSASLISLLVVELTMIVVATSGVAGFLRAMRGLGFPALLVTTMQFALRYLAVIADEAQRMMRARDLRGRPRRLRDRARVAGAIIGTLFLRSSARAARVAQAMAARGFTGDMPTFRLPPVSAADDCVCVLVVVFFWAVQAAGYRG